LKNCHPPDSDGTAKENLCDTAGIALNCGGKPYCCPSVGGTWTSDMTKCPNVCPAIVGKTFTLNDYSIWRGEFINGTTLQSDYDCDGKVTLNDYSIWRQNYINAINGVTL
jgi:hypothetical protein